MTATAGKASTYQGNDKLLYGIILGVITFWLFAQTTLNIAPAMQKDLGLDASMMNIAVAITALFSGIFIVVIGGIGRIEGPILGVLVFYALQTLLADFGAWYLLTLGLIAIAVMLFARRGLWGLFTDRTGIRLFPIRRRLTGIDTRE